MSTKGARGRVREREGKDGLNSNELSKQARGGEGIEVGVEGRGKKTRS